MNKQAILIMYHADFYVLEKLLKQIDSQYFDIFLHVDKKVEDFDFDYTKKLLKYSNLYFVKRLNVKWSSFSQIKCELTLLEAAVKNNYSYYHLISGNDMLLKHPKQIFNFFDNNYNYEFIGYQDFNDVTLEHLERIKYYHFLNGNRRHNNKFIRLMSNIIHHNLLVVQKWLGVNRLRGNNLQIRKGANWVSITKEFACYVLSQKKFIFKTFRWSNCADELFIQTIAYNSKFKSKIFNKYNNEHRNVKRFIDWNRGEPYIFTIDDYKQLIHSGCFFARKFSTKKDKEIVDKLYEAVKDCDIDDKS